MNAPRYTAGGVVLRGTGGAVAGDLSAFEPIGHLAEGVNLWRGPEPAEPVWPRSWQKTFSWTIPACALSDEAVRFLFGDPLAWPPLTWPPLTFPPRTQRSLRRRRARLRRKRAARRRHR